MYVIVVLEVLICMYVCTCTYIYITACLLPMQLYVLLAVSIVKLYRMYAANKLFNGVHKVKNKETLWKYLVCKGTKIR